jgi:hypothetical protein
VPDAVVMEPAHFACCLRAQPAAAVASEHSIRRRDGDRRIIT